jgi:rubrerythrin
MNELTKIKYRILARIENYIGDIEFAEEKELTEDEKTIFASVKHIINEEFDRATLEAPLPRFIIDEDGKIKQFKTSDEDIKITDEEMKKFQKYIDEYEGMCAEDKDRICKDAIATADAIFRLSSTCGVSYYEAKDMVIDMLETIKRLPTDTAKWVVAGIGIDCMGNRFKEYKCSKCGNIDLSHRKNKFCPGCGRRMEG